MTESYWWSCRVGRSGIDRDAVFDPERLCNPRPYSNKRRIEIAILTLGYFRHVVTPPVLSFLENTRLLVDISFREECCVGGITLAGVFA